MPIQSLIHRDQRYVHTVCSGEITIKELIEYQDDIWRNGDVSGFDELFDAINADFSRLNLADVFQLSLNATEILSEDKKPPSRSKMALIIQPGTQEKLADFYRSTQEMQSKSQREIHVFYNTSDALNWLQDDILPISTNQDLRIKLAHSS